MRSKVDLSKLEQVLAITFKDKQLLLTALRHRSYINEYKNRHLASNERLEFLGDAVLEFVTTDFLYKAYQNYPEGDLTNIRAAIVCTQNLAQANRQLKLNQFFLLGKGEKSQGGNNNDNLLADLFEAVIGAIYLDRGLTVTAEFIRKNLLSNLPKKINLDQVKGPKSLLQEKSQRRYKFTPEYKILTESQVGPNHHFEVGVYIGNKLLAKGSGPSKKTAQEKAAQKGLEIIDRQGLKI